MKLWKRNAIAAAIVLFVCGAVYLNWSYSQDAEAGKNLGEAALVDSQSNSLLNRQDPSEGTQEDGAAQEGADSADETSGSYFSTARLNR